MKQNRNQRRRKRMAKSFAQVTGGEYAGKEDEIDRMVYAMHTMGSYQIVQELMCYLDADELKKFNDHINRHYDLAEIEKHFEDIPF
jgi:hypothetical protein